MPTAQQYDQQQIVDALWAKGVLWWKLRPVQKLMYDREMGSSSLFWVDNCSRRLGKSYRLIIRAIEVALSRPESQIRYAAPTQKALKKIVKPLFGKICKDAPLDCRPVFNSQEGSYIFPNKSEIHIAGVNNGHGEDLRGTEAHLAIVDEAGFIDDLEYLVGDILMPQLLTTGGRLILSSTPSRTPAHPFKKYCARALKESCYSEYDIYQAGYPPDLIEKFKKEAGKGDPLIGEKSTTWKREYLCQFVVDEEFAIIPEWKPEFEQPVVTDEYFQFYQLYEFMDMGVKDKTVIIFAYYDFLKAKLMIVGEIVMRGPTMTTEKIAAAIKLKELDLWPVINSNPKVARKVFRRIADNNNPLMLLDLGSLHGIHFQPTQKTGKTERTTILEAMVNELRIQVGRGGIIVDPSCTETIGCLRYGIWNENRTTFERVEEFGHFDALASLIYGNRDIDRHTNPIPPGLNVSPHTHFIAPSALRDPLVDNVKKMMNLKRRRG